MLLRKRKRFALEEEEDISDGEMASEKAKMDEAMPEMGEFQEDTTGPQKSEVGCCFVSSNRNLCTFKS